MVCRQLTYLAVTAGPAQLDTRLELAVAPLARLVRVALAALGALGSLRFKIMRRVNCFTVSECTQWMLEKNTRTA